MSNESIVIDAPEEEYLESIIDSDKKIHPWRICPIGTHLVKEHPLHIPPSKKHPDGQIFKPSEQLDPNLVKALIATESGFRPMVENIVKKIHARGLMQIVEKTHEVIGDHKGELRDYLIRATVSELFDPSTSICIGARWLFRKKETASHKLHHDATWFEAVADYKDYLNKIINGKEYNHKPLDDLLDYYSRLVG